MTTRLILKIIIFKIPFNPTINNYSYYLPNFDPRYTVVFQRDATLIFYAGINNLFFEWGVKLEPVVGSLNKTV